MIQNIVMKKINKRKDEKIVDDIYDYSFKLNS